VGEVEKKAKQIKNKNKWGELLLFFFFVVRPNFDRSKKLVRLGWFRDMLTGSLTRPTH
jgi:hypothetical protein